MRPPHLALVTEHLPHSLHAVAHNPAIELGRARVLALAADAARALVYLHSRCARAQRWPPPPMASCTSSSS